jgi:hypothetical protein
MADTKRRNHSQCRIFRFKYRCTFVMYLHNVWYIGDYFHVKSGLFWKRQLNRRLINCDASHMKVFNYVLLAQKNVSTFMSAIKFKSSTCREKTRAQYTVQAAPIPAVRSNNSSLICEKWLKWEDGYAFLFCNKSIRKWNYCFIFHEVEFPPLVALFLPFLPSFTTTFPAISYLYSKYK